MRFKGAQIPSNIHFLERGVKQQIKQDIQPITKHSRKSHSAFMLLDAVMGICICASAFVFAFMFLYALTPTHTPTSYEVYKGLFVNPIQTSLSSSPNSSQIQYEILEHSYTSSKSLETLRFYIPQSIR